MIYILKFERKLGNPNNPRAQAQYYVGYCDDDRLHERLAEHQRGTGAAITRACVERGIGFSVVLTLPGGTDVEAYLKYKYKNTRLLVERYERNARKLERWIHEVVAKGAYQQ